MRYCTLLTIIAFGLTLSGCQPPCRPTDIVCETYVHRYGIEMAPEEWKEQGRSGQVVTMLKDGVTVTKNFSKGVLQGECAYTFPHRSTIQRTEHYQNGTLMKESTYYPSGILCEEIDHVSPMHRVTRTYFDQGTLKSVETIQDSKITQGKYYNLNQNMESGVEDSLGKRTNRDPFGQLVSIDQIKGGELQVRTTYHSNGIPESHISYQNGEIHGLVRRFMPAGDPKTIEHWVNGCQEGIAEIFQNGEKVAEVPYRAGARNGVERRFSEDGKQVVEEVTWVNDQQHGPSYRFVNGRIVEVWYFHNQQVNKETFDRLTGPPML